MTKMRVEVCIISARGIKRPSSLWKLQWYAVGWIDPNNKYCTKIDASGDKNPTWKTKFSALVDGGGDVTKSPSLQVQVYSRDPIFLREKLHGTAVILLKEFLDKYYNSAKNNNNNNTVSSTGLMEEEEVGSFQLRKKSSGKPLGFVDVSIRVFEERDGGEGGGYSNYYSGKNEEGFELGGAGRSNEIFIGEGGWSNVDDYHHPHPPPSHHHQQPFDNSHPQQRPPIPPHWRQPQPQSTPAPPNWRQSQNTPHPSAHPMMPNNSNMQPYSVPQGTPSSYRPPPPPPPPPPSHVGFLPTFLPRADHHYSGSTTYMNNVGSSGGTGTVPTGHGSGGGGARNNNGLAMGMSAGALAAGAVLFGDDFMSGFDIPGTLQDAPVSISTQPPFQMT